MMPPPCQRPGICLGCGKQYSRKSSWQRHIQSNPRCRDAGWEIATIGDQPCYEGPLPPTLNATTVSASAAPPPIPSAFNLCNLAHVAGSSANVYTIRGGMASVPSTPNLTGQSFSDSHSGGYHYSFYPSTTASSTRSLPYMPSGSHTSSNSPPMAYQLRQNYHYAQKDNYSSLTTLSPMSPPSMSSGGHAQPSHSSFMYHPWYESHWNLTFNNIGLH